MLKILSLPSPEPAKRDVGGETRPLGRLGEPVRPRPLRIGLPGPSLSARPGRKMRGGRASLMAGPPPGSCAIVLPRMTTTQLDVQQVGEQVQAYLDAGVETFAGLLFAADSVEEELEAMERFSAQVIDPFAGAP